MIGALPRQIWRANTVRLFGNWLTLVAAAKARRAARAPPRTSERAAAAALNACERQLPQPFGTTSNAIVVRGCASWNGTVPCHI